MSSDDIEMIEVVDYEPSVEEGENGIEMVMESDTNETPMPQEGTSEEKEEAMEEEAAVAPRKAVTVREACAGLSAAELLGLWEKNKDKFETLDEYLNSEYIITGRYSAGDIIYDGSNYFVILLVENEYNNCYFFTHLANIQYVDGHIDIHDNEAVYIRAITSVDGDRGNLHIASLNKGYVEFIEDNFKLPLLQLAAEGRIGNN